MASIYYPNSETYLAIKNEKITSLIAMAEDYTRKIIREYGEALKNE